jgi:hypothetical protein
MMILQEYIEPIEERGDEVFIRREKVRKKGYHLCIIYRRRFVKQYNEIVHFQKQNNHLVGYAADSEGDTTSGHGFLIASCILTMQPLGPLTAPNRNTQISKTKCPSGWKWEPTINNHNPILRVNFENL